MTRAREPMPKRVDWAAIHARLAAARAAFEGRVSQSPERQREVLELRARREAAEDHVAVPSARGIGVVEFSLAHELYAVPCEFVVGVEPLRELAPLPNLPAHLLGVACLRGRMISVVDLRRFFGLPHPGLTDMNRLIVLAHAKIELALIADHVRGVTEVSPGRINEPLPGRSANRASFCRGVAPFGVIVLDVPRLLASRELLGAFEERSGVEERR